MGDRGLFLSLAICFLLFISQSFSASDVVISKDVINKKVERTIDVSSQLVKIQSKITLENAGKTPQSSVLLCIEPNTVKNLAFIGGMKFGSSNDETSKQLKLRQVELKQHKNISFWEVTLPQPLEAGRTTVLEVESVFSHLLVPHPLQITQNEKQLVRYDGNLFFYSPYATTTQTTNVVLSSANVESFTKAKPVTQSESNVNYGPFENINGLTEAELSVHYENNNPFLSVTYLERVIELSHWGNIAIEESIHLDHTGAILKGSFSRYDYQREQSGTASVKSFKTLLPAAATDVYYRDEIGNISTSHLKVLEDSVEVDLRPRFPLFGGWKTNYVLGYNLPSYEYLFSNGDDYILKMRFVDHIFDDMTVDEAIVKIILPEGAKPSELNFPYDVRIEQQEQHFTYLDTVGRPVIVVRKSNLVESHILDFEINYKFQKILMLQEPLLVVLAFYLLFLLVIFYVRLDFSISKDACGEAKLRAASLRERTEQLQDKITSLFQELESLIAKTKVSKDVASMQGGQKKINAELKTELQLLQDLYNKLKVEAPETSEKANELLKLNRQTKDVFVQHVTLVEKLAHDKVNKASFIQNEQTFNKKKEELNNKIDAVVSSL